MKVKLAHAQLGWISSTEAKHLYMALTGFSSEVCDVIPNLAKDGGQIAEMICYLVNHSVWTVKEAEAIILAHPDPERFFTGQSQPEQRHLFLEDLHYALGTILGKMLDLQFTQSENTDDRGQLITDLEDNRRQVNVEFDPNTYSRIYQTYESITIRWSTSDNIPICLQSAHCFIALIRPRTSIEIERNFINDLASALAIKQAKFNSFPLTVCLLYPRDFDDIAQSIRDIIISRTKANDIQILICPETLRSISVDAIRRLSLNRLTRK